MDILIKGYTWSDNEEGYLMQHHYDYGDIYSFEIPLDNTEDGCAFAVGLIIQVCGEASETITGSIAMLEPEIIASLRDLGTKLMVASEKMNDADYKDDVFLDEHYHIYNGGYTFHISKSKGFVIMFNMLSTETFIQIPMEFQDIEHLGKQFLVAADKIDEMYKEEEE